MGSSGVVLARNVDSYTTQSASHVLSASYGRPLASGDASPYREPSAVESHGSVRSCGDVCESEVLRMVAKHDGTPFSQLWQAHAGEQQGRHALFAADLLPRPAALGDNPTVFRSPYRVPCSAIAACAYRLRSPCSAG